MAIVDGHAHELSHIPFCGFCSNEGLLQWPGLTRLVFFIALVLESLSKMHEPRFARNATSQFALSRPQRSFLRPFPFRCELCCFTRRVVDVFKHPIVRNDSKCCFVPEFVPSRACSWCALPSSIAGAPCRWNRSLWVEYRL